MLFKNAYLQGWVFWDKGNIYMCMMTDKWSIADGIIVHGSEGMNSMGYNLATTEQCEQKIYEQQQQQQQK